MKKKIKTKRKTRLKTKLTLLTFGIGICVAAPPITRRVLAKVISRNESSAISHLKNLSSAQAQLQAYGPNHTPGGEYEYGDFHDLRNVISKAFTRGSRTRVEVDGYIYEAHLPADREARRTQWTIYAWPVAYGWTGKRAFIINQRGDILSAANQTTRYSESNAPAQRSAWTAESGELAINTCATAALFPMKK